MESFKKEVKTQITSLETKHQNELLENVRRLTVEKLELEFVSIFFCGWFLMGK